MKNLPMYLLIAVILAAFSLVGCVMPQDYSPKVEIQPKLVKNRLSELINTPVNVEVIKSPTYAKGSFDTDPELPEGLTIDPSTGTISGQSDKYAAARTYEIIFTGTDGYSGANSKTEIIIGIYKYQPKTKVILQQNINTELTEHDPNGDPNIIVDLNVIDTSLIEDMSNLLVPVDFPGVTEKDKSAFNEDISAWNVSSVKTMHGLFSQAGAFNQDISGWDVSSVTTMSNLFLNAQSFNQNLNSWNVGKVTNMQQMFMLAKSYNGDISDWDVSSVTTMSSMFYEANAFNQDIGNWNVENTTDMTLMFNKSKTFNQDISSWNVENNTNMGGMFKWSEAFNQNISSWNVGSVTDMSDMFFDATAFNQDISQWKVDQVTEYTNFKSDESALEDKNTPAKFR